MTDSELDGLLLLSLYPNKKEKINLSSKEVFVNLIIQKLESYDLLSEFGYNVIFFLNDSCNQKKDTGILIYESFMSDIKIFKMAALKTFDEFMESIK
jgi:hypothetical protein